MPASRWRPRRRDFAGIRPKEAPVTHNTDRRMLSGQCQCGDVRYAVADEFVYAANCHCSNCRRTTGSAFKPFAGIARDRLRVTEGKDNLMIVGEADGHDAHCKMCGSLLYSVVRDGAFVHVAMGTLIDDPEIRPTKHIFVGSKAPWFTITDDLPQFEEHAVSS
ncbi:MAG: GFA family protein [Xanthobacteraceae bacterium]|nr:GFA family protein [Xanthobacteraceae bacterium]